MKNNKLFANHNYFITIIICNINEYNINDDYLSIWIEKNNNIIEIIIKK
jgi:hypothetical protein